MTEPQEYGGLVEMGEFRMPEFSSPEAAAGIAERLAKAMALMSEDGRLEKTGWNAHFKFEFASSEDVKQAARSALAEVGVAIIPSIAAVPAIEKTAKQSLRWRVPMTFTIVCEEGYATIPFYGESFDTQDKGIPKCLTTTTKYFLMAALLIPTGDDEDSDRDGVPGVKLSPEERSRQAKQAQNREAKLQAEKARAAAEKKREGQAAAKKAKAQVASSPSQTQTASGKVQRPMDAVTLKAAMDAKVRKVQGDQDAVPASGQQVGLMANKMRELFVAEEDNATDCYRILADFLFGKTSVKEFTKFEAKAVLDWLLDPPDDTKGRPLNAWAIQEGYAAFRAHAIETGNEHLLNEAQSTLAAFEKITAERNA